MSILRRASTTYFAFTSTVEKVVYRTGTCGLPECFSMLVRFAGPIRGVCLGVSRETGERLVTGSERNNLCRICYFPCVSSPMLCLLR